jgi:serine/threonine protein kinase/tetratricopeptide (TPR) repeat protein
MNDGSPEMLSLFCAVLERPSAEERAAYLDAACGKDAGLRARIEALLRAHEEAGGFLQGSSDGGGAPRATDRPICERPGTSIGPYRLLEQIGEGGFGIVFVAEQTQPVRRRVALKVIKPGMDTKAVLARFDAERQVLALMDHPNVARIFDAGTTDSGRPYFVMELVKGVPITRFCDERRLTPRQRLELFVPVCAAIQHAHQKGIIHRDVKPSNVLVCLYDGKPVPKVIDFGVAKAVEQKLTADTLVTGFGSVVGTPEYMSPEQAEVNRLDVDTRSDVYSLGVLLYELLTGTTPLERKRLKGSAMPEVLRIIREEEAPRPSTRLSATDELPAVAASRGLGPKELSGQVRGELDWVVMRALEKDRNRRYESPNAFALDVQRYLADEPVLACPPSVAYRLRKLVRQHRAGLAAAVVLGLGLLLAVGSAGWVWRDVAGRQATTRREVDSALREVERLYNEGDWPRAEAALGRAEAFLSAGEAGEPRRQRVRRWRSDLGMVTRLEEIRLKQATGHDPLSEANEDYKRAFRQYGLDLGALSEEEAAGQVGDSAIKDHLVGALYDLVWGMRRAGRSGWEPLVAVARRADPDAWRDRLTDASRRQDRETLVAMAKDRHVAELPPAKAQLLARALLQVGESALALDACLRVQQRHPGDVWLNALVAGLLPDSRKEEAVGYWRAFLAARPNSAAATAYFANNVLALGRPAEAEAALHQALRLQPDCYDAHCALGFLRRHQRRLSEAEAALREATRLRPDSCVAQYSLAQVLWEESKQAEAAGHFRTALRIRPDFPEVHGEFGDLLSQLGEWAEAAAAYREAIRRRPDFPEAHCGLARALGQLGQFGASRNEYRIGHLQGSRRPGWGLPSAQWLRDAERLLELERRLPAVLRGEARPRDGRDALGLASVYSKKGLHAAAARLYAEGLAAEPKQAGDLGAGQRYDAACSAALAGCGRGEDAGSLGGQQRARLRQQALTWLEAELAAHAEALEAGKAVARPTVAATLRHWQRDADLAGLRGDKDLNLLPEAERPGWRRLWERAEALRRQAEAPAGK